MSQPDRTDWGQANEALAALGVFVAQEMLRDREGTLAALEALAASDPATWPSAMGEGDG